MHPQADKLNFSGQRVNPKTRSIDVRAELPNADGSLGPGQFLRVLLGGATRPNTISVPQRAVIDSPFGKIVFKVTPDNKLAPQPVELDGWTGGNWAITKGLQNGDCGVGEGFIKVNQQGMTVKVVPYVAGLAAMRILLISRYPEISPPVVTVRATYPGASAEARRWLLPCRDCGLESAMHAGKNA